MTHTVRREITLLCIKHAQKNLFSVLYCSWKHCFVPSACQCTYVRLALNASALPTTAPFELHSQERLFDHIRLPVWSGHLTPWLKTICNCMPLINDAHRQPTFLVEHANFLMLFTNAHFSLTLLRFCMTMTDSSSSWQSQRQGPTQGRIFIFWALGYFKLGAPIEGLRRLMSYKSALHVFATFTEQVFLIQHYIPLFWLPSISRTRVVSAALPQLGDHADTKDPKFRA